MSDSKRAIRIVRALVLGLALLLAQPRGHADSAKDDKKEENFQWLVPEHLELIAGQSVEFPMRLQPSQGYRASAKGPLRIDITPGPQSGVKVKKRRLSLRDATNPSSAAPVFLGQVSAAQAGSYPLDIGLRFWLCRGKLCRPAHAAVTLQLEVSEAAPPELPDAGIPSAARTAPN